MENKEILAKIEKIKQEIEADACDLIREKIQQRELNLQKSGRNFLLAPVINALRRRLLVEINHMLEPILENQKEINLRLLKEIEKIKQSHEPISKTDSQASQAKR
ncbi:MAG: hypothetical protein JXI33_07575 [Candidatus Aminicenantes bacterium]|nr:hypothetical protein [Candidatus Aminicenantes bacterium]